MRITNPLTPVAVLSDLLKKTGCKDVDTVRFKDVKHDADLCPRFTEVVEHILQVYGGYHTDVHDIQGFTDQGVDVLLRYRDDDGVHKIGLQIKSYDELEAWTKGRGDVLKTLTAQWATAVNTLGVEEFFVVLCTDALHHRSKIRRITSALKTFPNCTIIKPKEALGLFERDGLDILIDTIRLLCDGDHALKAADDYVSDREPAEAYTALTLVCQLFKDGPHLSNASVPQIVEEWAEFAGASVDHTTIEAVYGALVSDGLLDGATGQDVIDVTRLPEPLCALYFDQKTLGLGGDRSFRDRLAKLLHLGQP